MHTISRHRQGAQATCRVTRPGAESRAEAHGGILESWERRPVATAHRRTRRTPAHQPPGARAELSAGRASETAESAWAPVSEGNQSGRADGRGSRSGLIVAVESRRTSRREPGSSEGDRRGEEGAIGRDAGEFLPQSPSHHARGAKPPLANPLLEEPDALIALVRVCGGVGGQPPALPGKIFQAAETGVETRRARRTRSQTGGRAGSGMLRKFSYLTNLPALNPGR